MANKFFQPGEERAAKVSDLFATIAPRYDLINDLQSFGLHRFWKKRLVKMAKLNSGERALDVCCGTGDLSFFLSEAGADVIGVDFSEAMLAVAKAKGERQEVSDETTLILAPSTSDTEECRLKSFAPRVSRAKKEKASWLLPQFAFGDAQHLSFLDNSFHVVTVGYGLRNLSNWERGLEEMWRVAKPGGRLLVLDFGKPDNGLWRSLYFLYLRMFVPLFGKIFCGDSQLYSYILESLKNYPAQHGVAEKMKALGCKNVGITHFLGGVMTINYGEK